MCPEEWQIASSFLEQEGVLSGRRSWTLDANAIIGGWQ